MLTILFDGIAYGMLLFVLACGLSVTLGLMNFVNLAHGAFAMAGGYVTVIMMNSYGISFYWCLPAAFIVTALAGVVLERLLYRRLYSASHLDQVLFSIGLVFMAIAAIDYFMGGQQQLINLPPELSGRFDFLGIDIGRYRLFIIVICAVLTVTLQLALTRTRFGSQLRAAVDDGRVARGMGINVSVIFALTFALGSGLAGLGGALGTELLGLDPNFPLKYLIYFMIVVTVGGTSSITGPFIAALLLGVADVAGKYYVPQLGAFIIYAVMILVLILRPHGLFSREGGR
ncbi:branched-chain amino acid ABC transporter permease [Rhizobium sp. 1399]|jgi:branched-chain amino acid transport system permease protein|uniref:branched-chain amino acid ABC transporter permease n=1 Tax=Rhizobium sp. 1399 TaxID=2817758 RepID=UPI002855A5CD|nr:branched-chain amino acid ABC transporter permease [Rhizobium sp. 1399]MDR6668646.1 branched-chain amino acid transport system permease protein [Rhizobium sp. 1399]